MLRRQWVMVLAMIVHHTDDDARELIMMTA
jgi:hypothetical protein